jgi:hypothetical protein
MLLEYGAQPKLIPGSILDKLDDELKDLLISYMGSATLGERNCGTCSLRPETFTPLRKGMSKCLPCLHITAEVRPEAATEHKFVGLTWPSIKLACQTWRCHSLDTPVKSTCLYNALLSFINRVKVQLSLLILGNVIL